MVKLVALLTLVLALAAFGCASKEPVLSQKTLIKCPTCGVECTVAEGMNAYEAAHSH